MTITYPRLLPENLRMSQAWIDLIDNVANSPSGGGTIINLSQVNAPSWKGTFETGVLERSERPVWSAWRKSLRGGLKTFLAYDVRHKAPLAYPTAIVPANVAGGWDGTANVVSLGLSGALALDTLPSTYQFKAGDRVGLEESGYYGYYEVLEDVTAVIGAATVTVAPFLHTTVFTAAAVCRVWRPLCQFIIDQNSWVETGEVQNGPVSFVGYQRL